MDRVPRNWGPNVTVLAALGPRGIAASGAVPGAADGAVVAAYLREQLLPALAPGTAIVLDNLSSHRGRAVREAVAAAGGRLVFLPTYSPDLNPIEFAFSAAKERVRAARARSWDALWPAIGAALDAVTPAMATAMIAECGYG